MRNVESNIPRYIQQIGQRSKNLLDERLLPLDITPQQARLVGFVHGEITQGKVVYQKDIEEAFRLKGSSVTSLVQGLERRGFITRKVDSEDERRKSVILLPKGQELVNEFEHTFAELEQRLLQGFSAEQRHLIEQALGTMMHNLE